jgi:hypothetical protein
MGESLESQDLTVHEKLAITRRHKDRLIEILGRFIRLEDGEKTDRDLVLAVMERWQWDQKQYIIDPNE